MELDFYHLLKKRYLLLGFNSLMKGDYRGHLPGGQLLVTWINGVAAHRKLSISRSKRSLGWLLKALLVATERSLNQKFQPKEENFLVHIYEKPKDLWVQVWLNRELGQCYCCFLFLSFACFCFSSMVDLISLSLLFDQLHYVAISNKL